MRSPSFATKVLTVAALLIFSGVSTTHAAIPHEGGALHRVRTGLNDLKGFWRALRDPKFYYRRPEAEKGEHLVRWRSVVTRRTQASSIPTSFSAVVWNFQKGAHPEAMHELVRNPEMNQADLVLLQEFSGEKHQKDFFENSMDHHLVIAPQFMKPDELGGADIPVGVATLSRVELTSHVSKLTGPTEPISDTSKMSFFSVFPIQGRDGLQRSLGVLNVHAINFVDLESFRSQMADILEILKTFHGPLLVAGDFNTWSLGRMDLLREVMATVSLNQVGFASGKEKAPSLDHVFVRGLEVERAQVLRGVVTSDHFPLLVSLRLAGQ